jgi:hypothetical protein
MQWPQVQGKGNRKSLRPGSSQSKPAIVYQNFFDQDFKDQGFWRLRAQQRQGISGSAMIAAISFAGCSTQTRIADIVKDPGHYAGKDVSIEGDVSESFSALGNGVFQMDDGSGRMWVYSQNFGTPGNGSR